MIHNSECFASYKPCSISVMCNGTSNRISSYFEKSFSVNFVEPFHKQTCTTSKFEQLKHQNSNKCSFLSFYYCEFTAIPGFGNIILLESDDTIKFSGK